MDLISRTDARVIAVFGGNAMVVRVLQAAAAFNLTQAPYTWIASDGSMRTRRLLVVLRFVARGFAVSLWPCPLTPLSRLCQAALHALITGPRVRSVLHSGASVSGGQPRNLPIH